MCDFKIMEKALKITWVNRIQDESQASWKLIPNQLLHKRSSLDFLTKCNFAASMLELIDKLPTFLKNVSSLGRVQNFNRHRFQNKS